MLELQLTSSTASRTAGVRNRARRGFAPLHHARRTFDDLERQDPDHAVDRRLGEHAASANWNGCAVDQRVQRLKTELVQNGARRRTSRTAGSAATR